MKTLFLMRHAKSDWGNARLSDHDRPLNERGKNDAPKMAKVVFDLGIQPQVWMCSTAVRAKETMIQVATAFSKNVTEILFMEQIYAFEKEPYLEVLHSLAADVNSAFIVAHNPALEDLVQYLTTETVEIPTATFLAIQLNSDSWQELSSGCGSVKKYIRPKSV